jgi:hypothetical protein
MSGERPPDNALEESFETHFDFYRNHPGSARSRVASVFFRAAKTAAEATAEKACGREAEAHSNA